MKITASLALAALLSAPAPWALAQGEIKGGATRHTAASARGAIEGAQLVLPASATGAAPWAGPLRDAPQTVRNKLPVVLFLHGSSGLKATPLKVFPKNPCKLTTPLKTGENKNFPIHH